MKAVIIAGGLGTRLRPMTYNTPKPIVPVANRPFIVHQIELLKQHGVTEVILNLHYLPDAIKMALGDGSAFGIKIFYSIEVDPLGTAGAVKNAEEFFKDYKEPLIIFNADILTDINISKVIELHKKKKARATLTLTPVEDPTAYGLVLTEKDGRVTSFLEKPSFTQLEGVSTYNINAGIYILDPKVFKNVPKGKRYMFEHDLFPKLLADGEPVYGYTSERFWLDIGNNKKYRMAHEAILRGEVAVRMFGTREKGGAWVGKDSHVSKSAKLLGNVLVGEKVKVDEGTILKDYAVLGNRVFVGKNSTIENSIIWEGCQIGDNVKLSDSIIGFNCRIESNCNLTGVVLADHSVMAKGSIINV